MSSTIPEQRQQSQQQLQQQKQQQQQQLPSSDSEADQEDVGAVVAKAKKAAASLWMIIHAQGCRLGPDRCPHRGCAETKRLLLHIKTCPAGPGFSCPVRGCDSARKLLAHYRRCRDIRARQAAGRCLKPPGQQQQHVCLVCSLMARHAKTLLDGSNKKVAVADVSKSERWRARRDAAIARHQQIQQQQLTQQLQPEQRGMGRSKSFEEVKTVQWAIAEDQVMPEPPPGSTGIPRTTSRQMMPPPPPRPPRGNTGTATATQLSTSAPTSPAPLSSMQGSTVAATSFETPPPRDVLMQHKIEVVAASVAAPPLFTNENANASALGKSYDSSRNYFPASLSSKYAATESQDTTHMRPRSESFQTASSFSELSLMDSNPTRQQGPSTTRSASSNCTNFHQAHGDEQLQGKTRASDVSMRKSASCGTLMSFVDSGGCTTIEEEEADETPHPHESHESDGGVFEMAG